MEKGLKEKKKSIWILYSGNDVSFHLHRWKYILQSFSQKKVLIDFFILSLFYLTFQAPRFHEFVQLLKVPEDSGNYSALIEWFMVPSLGFPFKFPGWYMTLAAPM